MGAKRNNMIALAAAGLFLVCGLAAAEAQSVETVAVTPALASDKAQMTAYHQSEIDIFTRDLEPAFAHRLRRIVSLDDFSVMRTEENTVILDTRSAKAFARGHLSGAVNVPLAELDLLKLAEAIPDRATRILIYSDRNIGAETGYRTPDSSLLPLNLMTFVTLYRFGYFEVYELGEVGHRLDQRLNWQSAADLYASAGLRTFN